MFLNLVFVVTLIYIVYISVLNKSSTFYVMCMPFINHLNDTRFTQCFFLSFFLSFLLSFFYNKNILMKSHQLTDIFMRTNQCLVLK